MSGKLTQQLSRYLFLKKGLFFSVFVAVVVFLFAGAFRLRINEDMYAIFPQGKQFQTFQDLLTKNKWNKQVFFSLPYQEESVDTDLEQFQRELEQAFPKELTAIQTNREINERTLLQVYQQRAIYQLDDQDYRRINARLYPDSLRKALQASKELLSGINGWYAKNLVQNDPFGLLNGVIGKFNPQAQQSQFVYRDGYLLDSSEKEVFITADLNINIKDTKKLIAFDKKWREYKKGWNRMHPKLHLNSFGTYEITVANALQIKQDTWLTSIISICGILLLLLLYFRSFIIPLFLLLPALFSILCGLGVIGWLHADVNAISVATASVLLGIVLDYSFHFFTHYQETGDAFGTSKAIAGPMLLGSFTTIVALGSLMFTKSQVLQDFGLLALSTLGGAVFFTLLLLPVFVALIPMRVPPKRTGIKIPKLVVRVLGYLLMIGSLCWMFVRIDVHFDTDINHLAFHPLELKKRELAFTGLNPESEKKIVVFAKGPEEKAARINDRIFGELIRDPDGINGLQSCSILRPSDSTRQVGEKRWIQFWKTNGKQVKLELASLGKDLGFSEQAFAPFLIGQEHPGFDREEADLLASQIGIDRLRIEEKGETSYMTVIQVAKPSLESVKQRIASIPGVVILDNSSLAKSMLDQVQGDFNYLLLFSSILVFITLLLVYGRIELTLLAFVPMLVSWLWILGVSDLAGLYFNFINIIVATFIFGLGDDFSIFTVDGLLQKSKYGKNALSASQSGIILSGLTTILGTGALIFAKHPAVHSIGWISVLGIGMVMLLTLVVQPMVFRFFVLNRKAKRLGPVTFFVFLYSIALFLYFFLGSMLINGILLLLIVPLPVSKKRKRIWLNFLISKLAKSTIYAGIHVRKYIHHPPKEEGRKPEILVANHTSFLDILVVLMLHPKTVIMVKKWVYRSPIFGFFIRYAGYLFIEEGVEQNETVIRKRLEEGYSIVIFPEGTRSPDGQIKRFHKGAFLLAQRLNVPVRPLYILGTHEVNAKNDMMINPGEIHVFPGEQLAAEPHESYQVYAKRVQSRMRSDFANLRREWAGTNFYRHRILENYLLKGPVLEWYIRVKWALERKHFEAYDALIGERKYILDIGTGYGYLPLYLHYRDPKRKIIGMDYDETKVGLAANGLYDPEQVHFEAGDIRTYSFSGQDVVFLNDVLHYLTPEEQLAVLEKVVEALNPGGVIFIRDGIDELKDRQKRTRFTEFLSTKLFRFNKVTNDLHFITRQSIEEFAGQYELDFEWSDHSKHTANVLMILRKRNEG